MALIFSTNFSKLEVGGSNWTPPKGLSGGGLLSPTSGVRAPDKGLTGAGMPVGTVRGLGMDGEVDVGEGKLGV